MKNYIKKTLLLIFLGAFIANGFSQNENPNKKSSSLESFYNIEANFGISTCRELKYVIDFGSLIINEKAKLTYKTLVYGVNFAGGVSLAHYAKAGLGIGFLFYMQEKPHFPLHTPAFSSNRTTFGVPLFLYLRSDFSEQKNSLYIDLKIGNNFLVTREPALIFDREGWLICDCGKFRLKNGLFLATNFGIALKENKKTSTNLSIGYRLISRAFDTPYDFDMVTGKPKYTKTGFTIADHQFVINLGVSF